jgi:predicted O-methyltransferase YrrM
MGELFRKSMRRIADRVFGDLARRSDLDNLYNQITAYIQIHQFASSSPVLRPLRGWALSPDAMIYVLIELELRPNPTIVEFGSGESTLVIASALGRKNAGRLLTVEQDERFISGLRKRVAAAGLERWVEFHHAPRSSHHAAIHPGDYEINLSALPKVRIDVGLIDGPSGVKDEGALARRIPLEWSLKNLMPDGAIFLDDARRPAEQAIIARVMEEHPGLQMEMLYTEKWLAKLTFVQS